MPDRLEGDDHGRQARRRPPDPPLALQRRRLAPGPARQPAGVGRPASARQRPRRRPASRGRRPPRSAARRLGPLAGGLGQPSRGPGRRPRPSRAPTRAAASRAARRGSRPRRRSRAAPRPPRRRPARRTRSPRSPAGPARRESDGQDRRAGAADERRQPLVVEPRRVDERLADVLAGGRPGERRAIVRRGADEEDPRRPRLVRGEPGGPAGVGRAPASARSSVPRSWRAS